MSLNASPASLLLLPLLFVHLCSATIKEDMAKGFEGMETEDGVLATIDTQLVLRSKLTTLFLPLVYIVVFVVGLPANALAIWVFLFRIKKKHPSSIYMANLALADLLFVIWVPLKIAYHFNGNDWTYGSGLCSVLVAFFYGNMYCSILFISCISVQRYWAVVHPLSRLQRSNCTAVLLSATVWLAVWVTTTPLYLYNQEVRVVNMGINTCHDVTRASQKKTAAGYFLFMGTAGFVLPSLVCLVSYVRMLKALRNSMADLNVAKMRKKAVILVVTVLVMFLVCFAPSNIMLLVHYALLLRGSNNNLYSFYITTLCLSSLNSCIDPFIYYYISEDFRNHVRNTFLCRSQRHVDRMKVSFSALKFSKKSNTYTSDKSNMPSTQSTRSTDC